MWSVTQTNPITLFAEDEEEPKENFIIGPDGYRSPADTNGRVGGEPIGGQRLQIQRRSRIVLINKWGNNYQVI